ncbi:hypothetical protein, partial [Carnimonas bestiolae]|uniref:hypothetical protein n=1 Tax=Carnimonas bestiolae TaxID=3402172 RepID=UPI003F4A9EB0
NRNERPHKLSDRFVKERRTEALNRAPFEWMRILRNPVWKSIAFLLSLTFPLAQQHRTLPPEINGLTNPLTSRC